MGFGGHNCNPANIVPSFFCKSKSGLDVILAANSSFLAQINKNTPWQGDKGGVVKNLKFIFHSNWTLINRIMEVGLWIFFKFLSSLFTNSSIRWCTTCTIQVANAPQCIKQSTNSTVKLPFLFPVRFSTQLSSKSPIRTLRCTKSPISPLHVQSPRSQLYSFLSTWSRIFCNIYLSDSVTCICMNL